jgi:6,7-dimethyl-8-ribityllumazine synthase
MSKKKQAEQVAPPDSSDAPRLISLNDHPSVAAKVRRAKAWGGIVAFGIVVFGSTSQGATLSDALLRGLVAGIIGLHVTWLAAVIAARRILKAQTVAAVEHAIARRRRLPAGRS